MRLVFAALAAGQLICGCAQETPPAEEVREHFQRGISGEGELGPINRGNDPFIEPRAGDPARSHP